MPVAFRIKSIISDVDTIKEATIKYQPKMGVRTYVIKTRTVKDLPLDMVFYANLRRPRHHAQVAAEGHLTKTISEIWILMQVLSVVLQANPIIRAVS